jgi:hypothetical protein
MFGGLAFMVNGHMCCGIVGDDFVVRAGPDKFVALSAICATHGLHWPPSAGLCSRGTSGMPFDAGPEIVDSMGLRFVSTLSAKQTGGSIW